MYWVYILECEPKDLSQSNHKIVYYVGSTGDLEKRIKQHKDGRSRYTHNKNVKLVYCETYPDRPSAYQRELALKRFSKKEKENLIKNFSVFPKNSL